MKKKFINLPLRISILITIVVVLLLISISALFFYTENILENEAISNITSQAAEVNANLDDLVLNVYGVSDTFAYDSNLYEYTLKNSNQDYVKKRKATVHISNALFSSLDMLRTNQKMSAYYNNTTGELFNFLDPNTNEAVAESFLSQLDADKSYNLSRFVWYSVRNNQLKSETVGNIRRDKAIIGSRREYSTKENTYTGIHYFAISEEELYNRYKDMFLGFEPEVYILTEDGRLLSSSNPNALKSERIDYDFKQSLKSRKYDRYEYKNDLVFVSKSNVNGWLCVVRVKKSNLVATVSRLYRPITILLIGFMICALIILFVFNKQYTKPIAMLDKAMMSVRGGNLNSYVDYKSDNEFGIMIDCYNEMLDSINHNMIEKLNTEKHKKELELEILMNQINPHFLYNTLETIIWKSADAARPDIGQIAASLGRMYRLSISGGKLFVSLQHEIEHVNAYLKIQESRYEDRFSFYTKISNEANLHEIYTLKMLLQPIIENSLAHGLDGLERKLCIRLAIHIDNMIHIRITDNGLGMSEERLQAVHEQILHGVQDDTNIETPRKKSTGIGLHNVHERLKTYYGDSASMVVWSKENFGTIIDLELPIKYKD